MAISRMQQPRQMYGLGSFVKKITKGVKKIVKSPIGKAAILGIGAFGLPGAAGQSIFSGFAPQALKTGASKFLFGQKAFPMQNIEGSQGIFGAAKKFFGGEKTFGKTAAMFGIGTLGGAGLQALEASGLDTDNPNAMPRDVEALKAYMRDGYMKLNPDATPMQVDRFIEGQTYEYRADGGRIGYADGMNDPSDLPRGLQIDTTTRNPMPENALEEEIESVVRIMMGPGSSGVGEPEDGTMKGYQFFRKQYLPKKITELSENFGYSEDEIYKMLNLKVKEFQESPELLQKPKMAMGGRIGLEGGTNEDFQKYLKGREKFQKQQK